MPFDGAHWGEPGEPTAPLWSALVWTAAIAFSLGAWVGFALAVRAGLALIG